MAHAKNHYGSERLNALLEAGYTVAVVLMLKSDALSLANCGESIYVVWDGNGVWLCMRRLHKGTFVWPKLGDTTFELTREEWKWLVQGVDWQRLSAQLPDGWRM